MRPTLFAWLRKFDVTPRAYLQEAVQTLATHERRTLRWQPKYRGYASSPRLKR